MKGAKDLFDSERGVFALIVLACVTVLCVIRFVTGEQWLEYTKWITITLIASKTVTTTLESRAQAASP